MKIKINTNLNGPDGLPLTPKSIVRDVCIMSLLAPMEGDDEKKKWEKYELWKKFRDAAEEVELKAEDIVLTKRCIARFQPQLIMGQCFEILENHDNNTKA
jgi:hypothetical protein